MSNAKDPVTIKGQFKIIDIETGQVLYENHNLIVNVGKERLAEVLISGTTQITEIGVGSDNTPPSPTQTDLISPILWKSISEKLTVGSTAYFRTTFGLSEANGTWREIGIRANTSTNRLIARQVITDFSKTTSNSVQVEWALTVV